MIKSQFSSFFIDVKNFFVSTFNNIHSFLNQYVSDVVLGIIGITIIAIIAVKIFIDFNNR